MRQSSAGLPHSVKALDPATSVAVYYVVMLNHERIQEMSLALIQVSVRCRRHELRERLERIAFDLLECGNSESADQVAEKLDLLERFISFGKLIYEIEPINAGILLHASDRIKAEMRQSSGIPSDGNISGIFKSAGDNQAKEKRGKRMRQSEAKVNAATPDESGKNAAIAELPDSKNTASNTASNAANSANNPATDAVVRLSAEGNLLSDWANAAIRQSAIVERIRQSGNDGMKLRAIIAEFPSVSDRTVRYDLQKLCSQGILERIGSGGPASSYRIRVL